MDFERDNLDIKTKYCFIIHPEFLSSSNQTALKEWLISRMKPIADISLQKFVIITSSSDFVFGKAAVNLRENQVYSLGKIIMKVNAGIMRNYSPKNIFLMSKFVNH